MLPNIVAVKAVDENVAAEVEEVDGGSSHRHLRSTEISIGNGGSAADLWLSRKSSDQLNAASPICWIGFYRRQENKTKQSARELTIQNWRLENINSKEKKN